MTTFLVCFLIGVVLAIPSNLPKNAGYHVVTPPKE